MDAAALSLNIKSDSVVQAANDLDRFAASATKAGAAAGLQGGGIARLVASVQSMDRKLTAIIGGLDKVNAALSTMAKAGQGAAAANDNVGRSIGVADAHVIAYTQHLAALATVQGNANAHVIAYQQQLAAMAGPQVQLNAHVEAYRKNLATLPPAMDKAAASAGALQANTGNIAAQFQDIGVTAAMGMNPLIIGLQQGTQLASVFAQSGGTMKEVLVGAFRQIASAQALLTIGLVALVAVAIQLAMAWFNSGSEADKLADRIAKLQTASDGVSSSQSVLGGVFDLTTGKMKTQTAAAINLARAQLLLQQATAQGNISKAARDLDNSSAMGFMGRLSAWVKGDRELIEGSARVDLLTKALKNNDITGAQAMEGFKRLADAGVITNEMFLKATTSAANYGMEIENVKTAAQGLADLERGKLSAMFMNPNKPRKTPKGPKTDAEKLADIYAGANSDIAAEKTRSLSASMEATAFEAARLDKATALLNSIQQKGIPVTETVRKRVGELAEEYAKLKIAADTSEAINASNDDIAKQRVAITDQTKLIGLYGDALARATREQDAQKRLRDALPKGEIVVMPNLTKGLSDDIEANNRLRRAEDLRKASVDNAYAMDLERAGLGLTGAAALQYAFVTDRLLESKRAGIALSPDELRAINAAGEAYAQQRYAIDQQAQALSDAREVSKSFWTDWINGAREGQNVFKSFADSAINALNRIIDKLLDKTLNGFLDSAFSGGLPRYASPFAGDGAISNLTPNALGGVYGSPARFANGGTFTNQVVTSPTLFRFANGGQLGEMGEAGPEAIMPLKRGPNGSLGVQMHGGGRPAVRLGDNHFSIRVEGGFMPDAVIAVARQAGEQAVETSKRSFQDWAAEWDAGGAVVS